MLYTICRRGNQGEWVWGVCINWEYSKGKYREKTLLAELTVLKNSESMVKCLMVFLNLDPASSWKQRTWSRLDDITQGCSDENMDITGGWLWHTASMQSAQWHTKPPHDTQYSYQVAGCWMSLTTRPKGSKAVGGPDDPDFLPEGVPTRMTRTTSFLCASSWLKSRGRTL